MLLQVREPFADSLDWARARGFESLPLYDSGVYGPEDTGLRVSGGGLLADRYLARAFPSSYVLDRNGVVVFARAGAVEDWSAYLPFLRDAAARSGD